MKSATVTQEEKQVIEMIRNHPNKEFALLKAIEIFTLFIETNELKIVLFQLRGNLWATSQLKKHELSRVDGVFYPITPAKKEKSHNSVAFLFIHHFLLHKS